MHGPPLVGCVSGWRDGRRVIEGCLQHIRDAGAYAYYLDGAYVSYVSDPRLAGTPAADCPMPDYFIGMGAPAHVAFSSEAHKRTSLAKSAQLRFPYARYLITVDADERLETRGRGELTQWLDSRPESELWWSINLYQDRTGVRDGYMLPRILRAHPSIEHVGHTDWVVRRLHPASAKKSPPVPTEWTTAAEILASTFGPDDFIRIAPLPGAESPDVYGETAEVPVSVARIRHDRTVRPEWRLRMSARYARLHRGPGGACGVTRNNVHRYSVSAGAWRCADCGRKVDMQPGEDRLEQEALSA